MSSSRPPAVHDPTRTVEALFSQSWAVFRKNWIVVLPPVIAGAVTFALMIPLVGAIAVETVRTLKAPPGVVTFDARIGFAVALVSLVSIVVGLWSYAAMYGMAGAAWSRGTTSFGDGWTAFRTRGGALFVSWIATLLVFIAAVLLALPTLGLSVIALPVALMYVMPAVVVGGRGGFAAVGESFRLARRSLGRSALIVLMQYAIAYGIGMIASFGILPLEAAVMNQAVTGQPQLQMPPLGTIVVAGLAYLASILLSLAFGGFVAVLVVGFYRWLLVENAEAAPEVR